MFEVSEWVMRAHFRHLCSKSFFNDIKNSSIQWVLTFVIVLWRFRSPLRLQLPKWEPIWECGCSFLCILLHSREHEMWLLGFLFGPHPCKPILWSWAQGWGYDIIPRCKHSNEVIFLAFECAHLDCCILTSAFHKSWPWLTRKEKFESFKALI